MENGAEVRERTYYVQGMNCAACEIVLEKKLVGLAGVRSVAASVAKGTVLVEHEGKALAVGRLNQLFEEDGYRFSLNPAGKAGETRARSVTERSASRRSSRSFWWSCCRKPGCPGW